MLKLSKLADYAVVVLVRLSHTEGCQTSPGVAALTGLPEPTVAKVLKILASAGLVTSQRGARGGYRLARTLANIPVADVVAALSRISLADMTAMAPRPRSANHASAAPATLVPLAAE